MQYIIKYVENFKFLLCLFFVPQLLISCSQLDEKTDSKVEYWNQQVDAMLLNGPKKSHVFEWVFALDRNAIYSGDSLIANLERVDKNNNEPYCIVLEIEFDEKEEKAKSHEIEYKKCI